MSSLPDAPPGFRWWTPDDVAALEEAWADETITRWNPVPAGADAARWIGGVEERWTRRLALDLVIDVDGAVAGEVGLSGLAPDRSRVELGFWVGARHRGRGLAATSIAAATAWAHDAMGFSIVWARTSAANEAAMATLRAAGFVEIGSVDTGAGPVQGWAHRS